MPGTANIMDPMTQFELIPLWQSIGENPRGELRITIEGSSFVEVVKESWSFSKFYKSFSLNLLIKVTFFK